MSDQSAPTDPPSIDYSSNREVVVSFMFGQGWKILSPDGISGFPAGGGLLPPDENAMRISIGPLNLQTMDSAGAAAAISQRVADLANVAQALALAQVQLAADLAHYKPGTAPAQ